MKRTPASRSCKCRISGCAYPIPLSNGVKHCTDFEPENPQLPEDQAQILADNAQDDVDGIDLSALEIVAVQKPVGFHVSDDRLDGVASFQLASDALCHAAFFVPL